MLNNLSSVKDYQPCLLMITKWHCMNCNSEKRNLSWCSYHWKYIKKVRTCHSFHKSHEPNVSDRGLWYWKATEILARRHLTDGVPNQGTQQSLGTSSAVSWGQEAWCALFCLIRIKWTPHLGGIKRYLYLLHYLFPFNLKKNTKTL